MSILQPKTNFVIRARRADGASAAHADDAVLRATGVVSLLAIGAVHFLQIVPTTESTPLLGVSFLFLIAACLAALFVETTLLAFSVYAALAHRALRTAMDRARADLEPARVVRSSSSAA